MPGIFGTCRKTEKEDLSNLMDNMIDSMSSGREFRIDKLYKEEEGIKNDNKNSK